MYNGLVERCFVQCVDSFRRKTLEKGEEQARLPPAAPQSLQALRAIVSCGRFSALVASLSLASNRVVSRSPVPCPCVQCVVKCTEKFLKHSARVSVRFQELNAGAMEAMVRCCCVPRSPPPDATECTETACARLVLHAEVSELRSPCDRLPPRLNRRQSECGLRGTVPEWSGYHPAGCQVESSTALLAGDVRQCRCYGFILEAVSRASLIDSECASRRAPSSSSSDGV